MEGVLGRRGAYEVGRNGRMSGQLEAQIVGGADEDTGGTHGLRRPDLLDRVP
jgi:hypothetical protein